MANGEWTKLIAPRPPDITKALSFPRMSLLPIRHSLLAPFTP